MLATTAGPNFDRVEITIPASACRGSHTVVAMLANGHGHGQGTAVYNVTGRASNPACPATGAAGPAPGSTSRRARAIARCKRRYRGASRAAKRRRAACNRKAKRRYRT